MENGGVSVVCAVKNRSEQLVESLPTWLALGGVEDVVIVDWDSATPVSHVLPQPLDERVRILRINHEPAWVLSEAYNAGVLHARCARVIKVDSDNELRSGFLDCHLLKPGCFYAGNWRRGRDENEHHLNGSCYFHKEDFLAAGGYNEFLKSYGWDDDDLYARMESRGIERMDLNFDTIYHRPHAVRMEHDGIASNSIPVRNEALTKLHTIANKILSEGAWSWRGRSPTPWCIEHLGQGEWLCIRQGERVGVPVEELSGALILAARYMMGGAYDEEGRIPWDRINSMRDESIRRLFDLRFHADYPTHKPSLCVATWLPQVATPDELVAVLHTVTEWLVTNPGLGARVLIPTSRVSMWEGFVGRYIDLHPGLQPCFPDESRSFSDSLLPCSLESMGVSALVSPLASFAAGELLDMARASRPAFWIRTRHRIRVAELIHAPVSLLDTLLPVHKMGFPYYGIFVDDSVATALSQASLLPEDQVMILPESELRDLELSHVIGKMF